MLSTTFPVASNLNGESGTGGMRGGAGCCTLNVSGDGVLYWIIRKGRCGVEGVDIVLYSILLDFA